MHSYLLLFLNSSGFVFECWYMHFQDIEFHLLLFIELLADFDRSAVMLFHFSIAYNDLVRKVSLAFTCRHLSLCCIRFLVSWYSLLHLRSS